MFRNPLIDAVVVLLVVLLIFGPKRLPQLGKSLGHGMREFKDGITGNSNADDEEERPELTQASASAPAPQTPASAEPVEAAQAPEAAPAREPASAPEVGSTERRS
jgi:sec-independent protein translocase protein TatA